MFVVVSVLLAHYHSSYWLLFTAFVGLNLLQSAFTDWCPMMAVLKKLGLKPQCRQVATVCPPGTSGFISRRNAEE